jgi:hypothetical protein
LKYEIMVFKRIHIIDIDINHSIAPQPSSSFTSLKINQTATLSLSNH